MKNIFFDKAAALVVTVIVVNWNGWRNTVDCVQSIIDLKHPQFHLVICDNGSSDDSFERLSDWLMSIAGTTSHPYPNLGTGPHAVRFEGNFGSVLKSVHLLRLPNNSGYAGAINRCLVWGQETLMARVFWLLNNDVKVHPQALAELVAATHSAPDIGLCGSVLLDWDHPKIIQAIGGIYRRPLAVGRHLKGIAGGAHKHQDIFFAIDYPVGASLYVTQEYLDAVGLMDEFYFLYYEEMDWVQRGRLHGFRPAVALKSLVKHKEGASTGSHGGVRNKSLLSEHYGVVNRLRITRKFWPSYLPVVWMSLWLVVLDRLVHGEWARARLVLQRMFEPQRWMRDKSA
jgi:hypothetical protein